MAMALRPWRDVFIWLELAGLAERSSMEEWRQADSFKTPVRSQRMEGRTVRAPRI